LHSFQMRITDYNDTIKCQKFYLDSNNSFSDVCFTDHNHGWIAGSNGTIFRTEDGGGYPSAIEQVSPAFTASKSVLHSYPNHALHTTSIIYQVKQKGIVSIEIYNVTGKKITTLVNRMHETRGEYKVEWNSEFVAKGVYFIIGNVNDIVCREKVVVR